VFSSLLTRGRKPSCLKRITFNDNYFGECAFAGKRFVLVKELGEEHIIRWQECNKLSDQMYM